MLILTNSKYHDDESRVEVAVAVVTDGEDDADDGGR